MSYEVVGFNRATGQPFLGTIDAITAGEAERIAIERGVDVIEVRPSVAPVMPYATPVRSNEREHERLRNETNDEWACLTGGEVTAILLCRLATVAGLIVGWTFMIDGRDQDQRLGMVMVIGGMLAAVTSAVVRGRGTTRWVSRHQP